MCVCVCVCVCVTERVLCSSSCLRSSVVPPLPPGTCCVVVIQHKHKYIHTKNDTHTTVSMAEHEPKIAFFPISFSFSLHVRKIWYRMRSGTRCCTKNFCAVGSAKTSFSSAYMSNGTASASAFFTCLQELKERRGGKNSKTSSGSSLSNEAHPADSLSFAMPPCVFLDLFEGMAA